MESINVTVEILPYFHKKSGNIYYVFTYTKLLNATNSNEGQDMIFYARLGNFYVREKSEFLEKFTQIKVGSQIWIKNKKGHFKKEVREIWGDGFSATDFTSWKYGDIVSVEENERGIEDAGDI